MVSPHHGFSDLPIEILQRIASIGTCESALALTCVDKTIRHACNHHHVFKSIIENCNGFVGPDWSSIPLSMDDPASAWARYALADLKARQWMAEAAYWRVHLDRDPSGFAKSTANFVCWAPQLMAASHPLHNSVGIQDVMMGLSTIKNPESNEAFALTLCLALCMVSKSPATDPLLLVSLLENGWAEEHWDRWLIADAEQATLGKLQHLAQTFRSRAMVVIGFLASLPCETVYVRDGLYPEPRLGASPLVPPTLGDAQLHSLIEFPPPFSVTTQGYLGVSHLAKMTSPHYLEDGEWTGVHTESRELEPAFFVQTRSVEAMACRPIRVMQFRTTERLERPDVLNLYATSVAKSGEASIIVEGLIHQPTGLARLLVNPMSVSQVQWSCLMTPFGIVGSWNHNGNEGWVWLWKLRKDSESFQHQLEISECVDRV